jgi:hypothetical protein
MTPEGSVTSMWSTAHSQVGDLELKQDKDSYKDLSIMFINKNLIYCHVPGVGYVNYNNVD